MGYFRLGKEREALAQRGESYRSAVSRFLESKGWRIEAESWIEGSFEDIIMAEADASRVYVECKASRVSLHSRKFLGPFCIYLTRFTRLPREARFRTCFFFREVSNPREFEEVFQDFEPQAVATLRARCSKLVRNLRPEHKDRNLLDPVEIDEREFLEFVNSVDVYEGDIRDLEDATRLRDPLGAARSSILKVADQSRGAEALRAAALADEVEETIVTELLPITKIPRTIVGVPDTNPKARAWRSRRKRVGRIKGDGIARGGLRHFLGSPPMAAKRMSSLEPVRVESSDWMRHPDKRIWLQELLNQALGAYCCSKGMYLGTGAHRYVFVPDGEEGLTIIWYPGGRKNKREVVQRRLGRGGRVMYAHRAIDLRTVFLGDEPYLKVESNWEFTADGREFLPAKVGQALRKSYRKKERNRGRLVDLVFWSKYLAGRGDRIVIPIGGDEIRIEANPLAYRVDRGLRRDQMDLDSLLSTPPVRFVEDLPMERAGGEESPLEPWLDSEGRDDEEKEENDS